MKVVNRRARFDYHILETVEAGLVLTGAEAKSARLGQVSLGGAFVKIKEGQAWVVNLHIHPYRFASRADDDPARTRRLLLGRREALALEAKMKSKRLSLVPTSLYTNGPRVKLQIGLARGRKRWEKRQALKRRDQERNML